MGVGSSDLTNVWPITSMRFHWLPRRLFFSFNRCFNPFCSKEKGSYTILGGGGADIQMHVISEFSFWWLPCTVETTSKNIASVSIILLSISSSDVRSEIGSSTNNIGVLRVCTFMLTYLVRLPSIVEKIKIVGTSQVKASLNTKFNLGRFCWEGPLIFIFKTWEDVTEFRYRTKFWE